MTNGSLLVTIRGRVAALLLAAAVSGPFLLPPTAAALGRDVKAAPAPSVSIVAPTAGAVIDGSTLEVVVAFEAVGGIHGLALEIDGVNVATHPNPPKRRRGQEIFNVDLSGYVQGDHTLQAFAWRGSASAGLVTASSPVTITIDRGTGIDELVVDSVPDEQHRAGATMGPLGGTLETDDASGAHYELYVPPGALSDEATISFAPSEITGLESIATSTRYAVDFEPSGLEFEIPATLSVTPPVGAPDVSGDLAAGWGDGPGIDMRLTGVEDDGTLHIPVPHFSGVTTLRAASQSYDNLLTLALVSAPGIGGPDLASLITLAAGLPGTTQPLVDSVMQLHDTIVAPAVARAGDDLVSLRVAVVRLSEFATLFRLLPIGSLQVSEAPPVTLDGVYADIELDFLTRAKALLARHVRPACSATVQDLADWFAIPISAASEIDRFTSGSTEIDYCAGAAVEPGPFPSTIDPSQQFVSGSFRGVIRAPSQTPGGEASGQDAVFPQPTTYGLHSTGASFTTGGTDLSETSGADGRVSFQLDRGAEPRPLRVSVTGTGVVGGFWSDITSVIGLENSFPLNLSVGPPAETRITFRSPPVDVFLDPGGTTTLCVDVSDAESNALAGTTVDWSLGGPGALSSATSSTNNLGVACTDYLHPAGPVTEALTASVTASAIVGGAQGSASVTLRPRWAHLEIEVFPDLGGGGNATNSTIEMDPNDSATLVVTLTVAGATPSDPPVNLAADFVRVAITSGGGLLLDAQTGDPDPQPITDANGQARVRFDPDGSTGDTYVRFSYPLLGAGVVATVVLDRTRPVTVSMSTPRVVLEFGETRQFSAIVQNTPDHSVTWSATGGAVNQNGEYTAGTAVGTFTVTAQSVVDPSASATATVEIITAHTIVGLYTGTCTSLLDGASNEPVPMPDGSFFHVIEGPAGEFTLASSLTLGGCGSLVPPRCQWKFPAGFPSTGGAFGFQTPSNGPNSQCGGFYWAIAPITGTVGGGYLSFQMDFIDSEGNRTPYKRWDLYRAF